jgi:hypothetical protein
MRINSFLDQGQNADTQVPQMEQLSPLIPLESPFVIQGTSQRLSEAWPDEQHGYARKAQQSKTYLDKPKKSKGLKSNDTIYLRSSSPLSPRKFFNAYLETYFEYAYVR